MYARTFIISYLIYYYLLASPRSSMFFFLSHLAHILRICAQIVQPLANSQIMEHLKSPFFVLMQAFALIFWLSILLLPLVLSSLVGYSDESLPLSLPRFLVLS